MTADRPNRLTQFAQLAEVIAAVAVVVSLVYLGRQVQDNTAAIRAAAIQAGAAESGESMRQQAVDTTLIRILSSDPTTLEGVERRQYFIWSRHRWIQWQSYYFQDKLGVLDAGVWNGYRNIICEAARNRGAIADWPRHRSVLDSGFVALVESC